MKGAAVGALEAARLLAGQSFAGELAMIAIGLHEAPGGRPERTSTWLLGEGRLPGPTLAVVCELSGHDVAVAHMGQATVEITITRPGTPTHELLTPEGSAAPLLARPRGLVVDDPRVSREELAAIEHPWVGAETYFVGEVHGGDFYNRFPSSCRIVGTRRWAPGNTLEAVEAEYRSLLDRIAAETGCTIELDLKLVRDAYSIEQAIIPLLARAAGRPYLEVTGEVARARSASRRSPTARSSPRSGSRPSTTARSATARTAMWST